MNALLKDRAAALAALIKPLGPDELAALLTRAGETTCGRLENLLSSLERTRADEAFVQAATTNAKAAMKLFTARPDKLNAIRLLDQDQLCSLLRQLGPRDQEEILRLLDRQAAAWARSRILPSDSLPSYVKIVATGEGSFASKPIEISAAQARRLESVGIAVRAPRVAEYGPGASSDGTAHVFEGFRLEAEQINFPIPGGGTEKRTRSGQVTMLESAWREICAVDPVVRAAVGSELHVGAVDENEVRGFVHARLLHGGAP